MKGIECNTNKRPPNSQAKTKISSLRLSTPVIASYVRTRLWRASKSSGVERDDDNVSTRSNVAFNWPKMARETETDEEDILGR